MKKTNAFKRKPLAYWVAASLTAAAVSGAAYAAAPLAGEQIKNLATVTYEDENGNKYTAQSNEAVITVAPQYKATIENDNDMIAAPGQTVYFPHTLHNTGNIADTYSLTVADDDGDALNEAKIYLDTNGNGQPDPGEQEVTSVTLAPDEVANLVVAYQIPSTAAADDVTNVKLTATSGNAAGIVEDIGDNGDSGTDLNDATHPQGTNDNKVTVKTGPVLVQNKESVVDAANNKVTYTLTIKNTGGADATNVDIIDMIPLVDHDGDGPTGTAAIPLTNVNIVASNGLGNTGDSAAALVTTHVDVHDLDGDGNTTETLAVIEATDATLPQDTTISIVFEADYDPAWEAGSTIENSFMTESDDPENPGQKVTTTSNKTTDVIPTSYGVQANDDDLTAEGGGTAGSNDGGDDAGGPAELAAPNDHDIQYVDEAASGENVVFTHTISNTGNGDDIFNLSVAPGTFPAGTIFTFWTADGSTQLTDSDNNGVPDTGVIAGATSQEIVVRAQLPAGTNSTAGTNHTATLTATSSGDTDESDTTSLVLGEITPPAVDLAAVGATQLNTGFDDDGTLNAHDEGPVLNEAGNVGETVTFPMSVANESGKSDSFILSADNVPAGWTVVFKDSNGSVITSTPLLPAGDTFDFTAEVTISSDPQQALGDAGSGVDGIDSTDNGTEAADAGDDGDDDYVMDVKVTSATDSSRNDSVSVAVDVNDSSAVSITPDGQNQVQPGGTVDYPHTVKNDGNVNENVEITTNNSDTDWNSSTLIETPTGFVDIGTLSPGDDIIVYEPDGTPKTVQLVDTETTPDGVGEVPLAPGEYVNIVNKVFAPANAPQGEVNTTTLQATDPDGTVRSTATDTSNIVLGQVRLDKTAALDAACDGTADGSFAAIQNSQVAPGGCVIWEITATNEGDALVKNVVINDSIPDFTTFVSGSLRVDGATKTDAYAGPDNDEAGHDSVNDKVTFYVGANTDVPNQTGGELAAGASATVRFSVKVDE